jgi:hypothetical protein
MYNQNVVKSGEQTSEIKGAILVYFSKPGTKRLSIYRIYRDSNKRIKLEVMGCGNSKSATITTQPQVKPGGTSNEGNNNQAENEPAGKISPQNDATETQNTQGICSLTRS